MAKITVVLCDVKPCNLPAEREYEVNGQTLYVCGEECFVRFWSREYGNWKAAPYRMQIKFDHLDPAQERRAQEATEKMTGTGGLKSNLHIVGPC